MDFLVRGDWACQTGGMTPSEVFSYGPSHQQQAELWLPDQARQPTAGWPVVVLVHGGFWRAKYGLDLMHPLAADLVGRGAAVWNIEYRRVGSNSDDPIETLRDVSTAIDLLPTVVAAGGLDLGRVGFVGHSAGGHLALWAAGGDPALVPALRPRLVIGQAAVLDLYQAAADELGQRATQDFLGGEPDDAADRYRAAQPRLDADVVHLVHGELDEIVPVSYSRQARDHRGRPVASTTVRNAGHMDVIQPETEAWSAHLAVLEANNVLSP